MSRVEILIGFALVVYLALVAHVVFSDERGCISDKDLIRAQVALEEAKLEPKLTVCGCEPDTLTEHAVDDGGVLTFQPEPKLESPWAE